MAGRGNRGRGKRPMENNLEDLGSRTGEEEQSPTMMRTVEQFLHTVSQMMQRNMQGQGGGSSSHPPTHEEAPRCQGVQLMEKFRRLNPPIFKGDGRPMEVEGWIREMEKTFQVIQCTNEEKVNLATYMLQDRADIWWQATKRNTFTDRADIGWEEFVREFKRKFFSNFDHNRLEMEFLQL